MLPRVSSSCRSRISLASSLLVTLVGAPALLAPGRGAASPAGIVGSGKAAQETRTVPPFGAISVAQGLKVDARVDAAPGARPTVTLFGDDNLLPLLETRVRAGGELVVAWKSGVRVRPAAPLEVRVVAPRLERVDVSSGASLVAQGAAGPRFAAEVSSGASARVSGIAADEVEVDASSGAEVKLAGRAKRMKVDLSSGVALRAGDLRAEQIEIEASSGVSAELFASGAVTGEASSGASVRVAGSPARCAVKASAGASVSCR
jgi:hypothetical protein